MTLGEDLTMDASADTFCIVICNKNQTNVKVAASSINIKTQNFGKSQGELTRTCF